MKKIAVLISTIFVIGIYISEKIHINNLFFLIALMLVAILIKYIVFKEKRVIFLFLFLIFLFSCFYIKAYDLLNLKNLSYLTQNYIQYEGKVCDIPESTQEGTKFYLKINKISIAEKEYKKSFKTQIFINNNAKNIKYGDIISFKEKMRIPASAKNEGVFNSRLYYKTRGIYLIAYVDESKIEIKNEKRFEIIDFVFSVKQYIISITNKFLKGDEAALMLSVLIGYRQSISEALYSNIKFCGLSHLTAVSGMHVSIMIAFISIMFGYFIKNRKIVSLFSIFILIFLMAITGFTASVVRASIMGFIYLFAIILDRESDSVNSLFLAMLIMLVINPFSIYDVGLVLSFVSSLSLLILTTPIINYLEKLPKPFQMPLATVIAVTIVVFPFNAYFFNGFSTVSPLANFLVVPIVPFIMTGGLLIIIFGSISSILGTIFAIFSSLLLKVFIIISFFLSKIPFSYIETITPTLFMFMLYFCLVYILFLYIEKKDKKRIKCASFIALVLIIFISISAVLDINKLELTFVNVGQGDSILIKKPLEKTILIDGGGLIGKEGMVGEQILMPYLLKRNISKIDLAIITHYHEDHADGILTLISKNKIKRLVLPKVVVKTELSEKILNEAKNRNVDVSFVSEKSQIKINNNFFINVLSPNVAQNKEKLYNENENSLVIKVFYKKMSFLLTGDSDFESQDYIYNKYDTKTDILKIPHHGSKYYINENFLQEAAPKYAIITVGSNNYGHPSKNVLDLLKNYDIKTYRTDQNGTISFFTDGYKINNVFLQRE